jgi:hypothetical protein
VSRAFRLLLLLAVAAVASTAGAQRPFNPDAALEDSIEILVLPREVAAIDSVGGSRISENLQLGENVLYFDSRGRIGLAFTDRRILAVATESGFWQSTPLRRTETPPSGAVLGGRVAVLSTAKRVLGFVGTSSALVESTLGPHEFVRDSVAGQNVAVVVTDRRALGISAQSGGFFEAPLRVGEEIQSVVALANHVTLQTSQRLLIFRGPGGSWDEEFPQQH